MRVALVLEPVSVASLGVAELRGEYTGEGGPDDGAVLWDLRQARREEINVLHRAKNKY